MVELCTYFDSAYLAKGLVYWHTLMKYSSTCRLHVVCMDQGVYQEMCSRKDVNAIQLSEIEAYRPSLLAVKRSRKLKEYYATMTATVPMFLFDRFGMETLFYTDSDMAFFSSADELEAIMGNNSIMVTDHENPVAYAAGRFNVGILGYRNDANCREFLEWWEARCLEWCEWRLMPDGRMADQGYLNILHSQPGKFKGVLVCPHPGIGLGPWNLAMHRLEKKGERIVVDVDKSLVCFHLHGYKLDKLNDTGWEVSEQNLDILYHPYHEMVLLAQNGKL